MTAKPNVYERWRRVPGAKGYKVSTLGRVMSYWTKYRAGRSWRLAKEPQRILQPSMNKPKGYLMVGLRIHGETKRRSIHRLVLLAFVGECPEGLESCHNNGNALDNRLENLRYDTHLANMEDHFGPIEQRDSEKGRIFAKQMKRVNQTHLILEGKRLGFSQKYLADKFNLTVSGVSLIVNGKRRQSDAVVIHTTNLMAQEVLNVIS